MLSVGGCWGYLAIPISVLGSMRSLPSLFSSCPSGLVVLASIVIGLGSGTVGSLFMYQ